MIKPLTHQTKLRLVSADASFPRPCAGPRLPLAPPGREAGRTPAGAGGVEELWGSPLCPPVTLCSSRLPGRAGSGGWSGCPPARGGGQAASAAAVSCSDPREPSPEKSLCFLSSNQELLHRFLGLPTEEVCLGLLEGDAAPRLPLPLASLALHSWLSQTEACTEVYRFSKAFDNVKLLGDEVGGEHTAAM